MMFERSDAVVNDITYQSKEAYPKRLSLGKKVDNYGSGGTNGTMQIHVSHLNLNSDRKFEGTDPSDGLGDVRTGSDF